MERVFTFISACICYLGVHAQLITATGSFSVPRTDHCSELLNNGKVLAFGGNNGNLLNLQIYNSAQLYTPASGTWANTGSMIKKRDTAASVLLSNGNVMVIGGEDIDENEYASCEIYNVATGTWSYTDSLNTARARTKAIMLNNGKILVVGGDGTTTCELYDQTTNTWSYTGSLNIDRFWWPDATKLPNGNVLVTGGAEVTAEIYDVATGTWSTVADPMNVERNGSTAILMSNGKVLIAGGLFTTSCEIFDPATNMFTPTGDLLESTADCKMIKLNNGNVLIYGIGDLFALDKKALQIYNPSSGTWSSAGPVGPSIFTAQNYSVHRLQTGKILYAGGMLTTGNGANTQCYLVSDNSVPTSIEEEWEHAEIEVYPNPSVDLITVTTGRELAGSDYSITDLSGRIVLKGRLNNESNTIVQIADLAPGAYLLKVGEAEQRPFRIIKE